MPASFIEQCEEEGMAWAEYGIGFDEVEPAQARDTEQQVRMVKKEIHAIQKVLEGVEIAGEMKQFKAWHKHLAANLKLPFEAEVDEAQDRGPLRAGDKLTVLAFEVEDMYGVLVNVKGKRGMFTFPLCDLAAQDEKSDNYDLIQEYRVWFANR